MSEESQIVLYKKEEIAELKQFLAYLESNCHRELVKLSLNFQHKRFEDNKGFATLKMEHRYAMRGLKAKIMNAVEQEIKELQEIIELHDR
jgi:hypothetical protein